MESYAASAKSLQLCLTLCDPKDGRPPGSPVPGILQARTLEWVAISFSNAWKSKMKVKLLSRVRPSATPWSAAFQAPPSMGFSRQEHWSGVPLPSPRWNHIVCCNNPLLQSSSTSQGLGEPLKSARVLWMDCSTVLDPDFWHPQLARWEIKAPLCSEGEKKIKRPTTAHFAAKNQRKLLLPLKMKNSWVLPHLTLDKLLPGRRISQGKNKALSVWGARVSLSISLKGATPQRWSSRQPLQVSPFLFFSLTSEKN